MLESLDRFHRSLDENRFYDAHEDLEHWWFPRRKTKTNEVLFIKGLINSAVAFELVKKNKIDQAKKVWNNYKKYKTKIDTIDSPYKDQYINSIKKVEYIAQKVGIITAG